MVCWHETTNVQKQKQKNKQKKTTAFKGHFQDLFSSGFRLHNLIEISNNNPSGAPVLFDKWWWNQTQRVLVRKARNNFLLKFQTKAKVN